MSLQEARVIKLPLPVYRALRSFVESSRKAIYAHNQGILYENTAVWVKYSGSKLKWRLVLQELERETIATLFPPQGIALQYHEGEDELHYLSPVNPYQVVFEPEEPSIFAVPIFGPDVVAAFRFYLSLFKRGVEKVEAQVA
jgi:hypothetical protein